MEEGRSAFKILISKPTKKECPFKILTGILTGKEYLGKPRLRWEDTGQY